MDSASRIAEETTKSEDGKRSQASSSTTPSPIATESSQVPTTSIASTVAVSTVATATSSVDDSNEANIATTETTPSIQVTTTTSSASCSSSSCPSSSTLELREGGDGNQSDENKECPGNDKDTKKDRTADGSVKLKSNEQDERKRGKEERPQDVDCQRSEETHSCETENKSSNARDGPLSPTSLVATVADCVQHVKMNVPQPAEDLSSNNTNTCSSSNTNYQLSCPPSGSDVEQTNHCEEKVSVETAVPVEASSSTSRGNCSDSTENLSLLMVSPRLPGSSTVSTEIKENPKSSNDKHQKVEFERPEVRAGDGVSEKIVQEAPITSTNGSVGSDDSHEGGIANDAVKEHSFPIARVTSVCSTSFATNSVEENYELDRNKQLKLGSMLGTDVKKQEMNETSIEAATSTFAEKRLNVGRKSTEMASITSNRVDNPVASSSAGMNELCNYSAREALVEKKSRESNAKSDGSRHDLVQGSLPEPRMADCTSSSGSNRSYNINNNLKEDHCIAPKGADVVDSSTGFNTMPRMSQPVTTAVIASTNHMNAFNNQAPRGMDPDSRRLNNDMVQNFNTRGTPPDLPNRSTPQLVAPHITSDNNKQSTIDYSYGKSRVATKVSNATNEPTEVEAVSSTNCPSKPSPAEPKRGGSNEQSKSDAKFAIDTTGESCDVITYQTSNQAIVASTIRHLFEQSALEEGKQESKPKLPPPFKLQSGNVHSNQPMLTGSNAPGPYAAHRSMSQYYFQPEKTLHGSEQQAPHQETLHQPNKSSSIMSTQVVGSTNVPTSSYNYHAKSPNDNWNHHSSSSSCYASKISSTSHSYPPKLHPETQANQNATSLESIPRIPAMVDTVLAMKKSKPEPERHNNYTQPPKDPMQQQKQTYMQMDPPRFQMSHQSVAGRELASEPIKKRNSIYVENPDFRKAMHPSQPPMTYKQSIPSATNPQSTNLSQLHMKPPDFSKAKDIKTKSESPKFGTLPVTPENFAEISKKYNYVSDLRLKNPPPHEESMLENNATYSNLYMKAPQFSMQKFQSKPLEQPTNVNHSRGLESRCSNPEPEQVLTKRYPQLSEDVVMSVVPSKPMQQDKDKKKAEYHGSSTSASSKHTLPSAHVNNVEASAKDSPPSSHQPHIVAADRKVFEHREYAQHYGHPQRQQMAQLLVAGMPQRQCYPNYNHPVSPQQQQQQQQQFHQQQIHQQQLHQQQLHSQYQKISTSQGVAAATSVIQSSRSKERAADYPSPKQHERRETSPSYYQYMPQPQNHSPQNAGPPPNKNTSPVPVISSKQSAAQSSIIQHAPSPVNPNSSGFSNKPSQSPGAMNPPYGWPSQSPNSRVGHSPVTSPHTPYRISQSPVGMNASSPHSPSFVPPSPSPTHGLRTTPTQMQPASSPVSYKNPYIYSQPEPQRSMKNAAYPGPNPQQDKSHADRHFLDHPEHAPRQNQPPLLPSEYMLNQIQKTNPPRQPERNEGTFPPASSSRNPECVKNSPNYAKSNIKMQDKPNYREMINNVYALRNATSEEDLNYQIIKRTLNKDISIRRSENDLSKSIFDTMPGSSKSSNANHLTRPSESLSNARVPEVHSKYGYNPDYNVSKKYAANASANCNSVAPASVVQAPIENKVASLPICNDLNRNDISVTVSKVIKSPVERPKAAVDDMQHTPRSSYVEHKELSTVVISKLKTTQPTEVRNAFSSRTRPPEPPPPSIVKPVQFTSTSSKRESPLDLSVKTVKTKADSTGCDDSACAIKSGVTNTLKVDFAPNFSKHVRGSAQQDHPPVQQLANQELPQRNTYAYSSAGTSRQYPHEQLATTNVQKAPAIPPQKDVYAGSYQSHRHKANELNAVQYQHYSRPPEQKAQPPAPMPQTSHQLQVSHSAPNRIHHSVIEATSSKHQQRASEQRPKAIDADQARKIHLPPPSRDPSYENYGKREAPPSQSYDRYSQQQAPHMPYKDQRYVDPTTPKYRDAYQGNPLVPVDTSRNEAYGRGMEHPQHHSSVAGQPNRTYTVGRTYNENIAEEKRAEETKALVGGDQSSNNYITEQYAGKKRPMDPTPSANSGPTHYHPPEKQVRVDELYRAHLAQTHFAQQHHQLQQQHQHQHMQYQQRHPQGQPAHSQAYPPHPGQPQSHYERRDEEMASSRKEVAQPSPSHYANQQYYEASYKQPQHPPLNYPPSGQIPSERHPPRQGNVPMSGPLQRYTQSIPPDCMQAQPTSGGILQRPPVHQLLNPAQPTDPNPYPPPHSAYQMPRHMPVSMHQGHVLPDVSSLPGAQTRQSPHMRPEPVVKPAIYQEPPTIPSSNASNMSKPSGEDTYRRTQSEQIATKPQDACTRLPLDNSPHVNSTYYTQHLVYSHKPPHPPGSANIGPHAHVERPDSYGEKYGRSEYSLPNNAASYQSSAIRSRESAVVTHNNQTWYPPIQGHLDSKKQDPVPECLPEYRANDHSAAVQTPNYSGDLAMKSLQTHHSPRSIRSQQEDSSGVKASPVQQHQVTAPPTHRGADQNVIEKLRTSIEMRGYEKQKCLNRKQMNGDMQEEESPKPDIASLLAARIRTKGELKGYTPIPAVEEKRADEKEKAEEKPKVTEEPPKPKSVEPVVEEAIADSSFDLMDWGSTCNDFVEQLQTGVKKRVGKKRKANQVFGESTEDILKKVEIKEDLPGIAYNGDIDQSIVEKIKSESVETKVAAADVEVKVEAKSQPSSSSSDEDKPLHLLRQQSLTDVGKIGSENERANTTTDQKSDGAESKASTSVMRSFLTSNSDSGNTAGKTSSVRENQRLKQEKRLAARLSNTSSSDSEDENKRNLQRLKRLTRKARSRTSGASTTRNTSDSSDKEEKKRNLFRERLETRKRKLAAEKTSSGSEPQSSKKPVANVIMGLDDREIKLPIQITPSSVVLKREIITKAQIKCMQPPSDKGASSCDADDSSKKVKTDDQKESSDDETNANADESNTAALKDKPPLRKTKLLEPRKSEETMTRSKRKKELEEQLANSKVLRNEKVVKNTPIKLKNKQPDKTPIRVTRSAEQKSSEEKTKSQISTRSSKAEKIEDAKRKLCEPESDGKSRKKTNKIAKEESSSSSSESSSETEAETVSKRVSLRRSRLSNESAPSEKVVETRKTRSSDRAKVENEKKVAPAPKMPTPCKKPALMPTQVTPGKNRATPAETNTEKFPPGWELEVYQYKRSLKVPQSLITIKGPAHHRVSTSLPDLDPHSSDASESFSENLKYNKKQQIDKKNKEKKSVDSENQKAENKNKNSTKEDEETFNGMPESLEGRSIIDILHQRVPFSRRLKEKKLSRVLGRNEPRFLPKGSNKTEMLATPNTNEIYRGENHHIREIFGGEDRPASAPPELTDSKEERESKVTFAKKYEEYLAAMNDVEFASKIRKSKKVPVEAVVEETSRSSVLDIPIKKEKLDEFVMQQDDDDTRDTEINACLQNAVDLKTEAIDANERDTPSVISEQGDGVVTPLLFKRKKSSKIRSSRRKGSSGFDYIRKKKKPTPINPNGQEVAKKKRNSPVELLTTRDENDISREIQRWVLNKGVGQSALHKAARLGYIDVIAFCLERLGLNPDPKDNAGYTPLHEACSKGRLDIARLLLQYGANHSEVAASGIRPLHEASENGYIEIARLLLSYGADPLVTTYSGQTPLMLADGNEMEQFIKNHLHDVQNTGPHKQPWKLPGPWYIYDPDTCGYDVLFGVPDLNDDDEELDDSLNSKAGEPEVVKPDDIATNPDANEKCDTNSNSILSTYEERSRLLAEKVSIKNKLKSNCAVVLDNIDTIERFSAIKQFKDYQSKNVQRRRSTNEGRDEKTDNEEEAVADCEMFEFEESEIPLPPLYLLKDEGAEKWVMLSDLCSLLKVKSKDTLLKQISPTLPPPTSKELLRELKMSDFLEKATCLQLLCAGEKLNIRSSKVVLVKYNESVRNLLGVKTIVMKF